MLLWHKDGAEGGTSPLGSLAPIKLPKSLSTSFIILMLSPIDTSVANNMRMINADLKFMIIYVCLPPSLRMALQLLPLSLPLLFLRVLSAAEFEAVVGCDFDSMGPSFGGVGYYINA